jgi:hypothetical protein
MKSLRIARAVAALWCLSFFLPLGAAAQSSAAPSIQFIVFSGSDCPPCNAWQAADLPKLKAMEVYKSIQYIHANKSIRSQVPARFFLPEPIKHLKEKLDAASGGQTGSPLATLVVNGVVHDFWWGTAGSDPVLMEKKIQSILQGSPYPVPRCLEMDGQRGCKTFATAS